MYNFHLYLGSIASTSPKSKMATNITYLNHLHNALMLEGSKCYDVFYVCLCMYIWIHVYDVYIWIHVYKFYITLYLIVFVVGF